MGSNSLCSQSREFSACGLIETVQIRVFLGRFNIEIGRIRIPLHPILRLRRVQDYGANPFTSIY